MSSRKSSPPLRIEPRPSRRYLWLVVAMHLVTLVAVLLASWPPWLKVLLLLLLGLYFLYLYHTVLMLRGPRQVRLAVWSADSLWRIQPGRGGMENARLLDDSLCLPWLVLLRFRTQSGHRYNLPLFRDSLPEELHRRLRSRLRVEAIRPDSAH